MVAELIAVGTELVRFGKPELLAGWFTERLQASGIDVGARCVVADDVTRLAATIAGAVARADLVVITGGLGTTDDDRTRQALALALGAPLEADPARVASLCRLHADHGRSLGEADARQALRPAGADWVDNRLGWAPGLWIERGGTLLVALPGVPAEARTMFDEEVRPRLARAVSGRFGHRRLRVVGRTEGSVDRAVADLPEVAGLERTILAGPEGVELLAWLCDSDAAARERGLDAFEREVRRRLGADCLGAGEETLASAVGRALVRAGKTVATVESCTGGLLGAALTEVAGSSAWYRGGLIVYNDALKRSLAGVPPEVLVAHGAVSEAVARTLAAAARARCGADVGVGITGIAGPGGAGPGKPVGLVHLAIEDADGTEHRELRLTGDRDGVRRRAVTAALDRLRRRLVGRA